LQSRTHINSPSVEYCSDRFLDRILNIELKCALGLAQRFRRCNCFKCGRNRQSLVNAAALQKVVQRCNERGMWGSILWEDHLLPAFCIPFSAFSFEP
jgi:hypothetical protein